MNATTGFDATDFNSLTGPLLVSAHNQMVTSARAMGIAQPFVREVSRFADKERAVRRCEEMRSHIRAYVGGQRAADRQDEPEAAPTERPDSAPVGADTSRNTDQPSTQPTAVQVVATDAQAEEPLTQGDESEEQYMARKAARATKTGTKKTKASGAKMTLGEQMDYFNSLVPRATKAGVKVKVHTSTFETYEKGQKQIKALEAAIKKAA